MRQAKEVGFSFLELSIDESQDRISRLEWSAEQRDNLRYLMQVNQCPIKTIMLSALRKYPLGSEDPGGYRLAYGLGCQAIDLAHDLGVGNVQLAAYDEYYHVKNQKTAKRFYRNLARLVHYASRKQVMVTVETMDDPFVNTLKKVADLKMMIKSPWLGAYADLGNLSAWQGIHRQNVVIDLKTNIDLIAAIHVKDTVAVKSKQAGVFKGLSFGTGDVDFLTLFRTLYRADYQGTMTVEMWNEDFEDAFVRAQAAFDFVSQGLKQVGYTLVGEE